MIHCRKCGNGINGAIFYIVFYNNYAFILFSFRYTTAGQTTIDRRADASTTSTAFLTLKSLRTWTWSQTCADTTWQKSLIFLTARVACGRAAATAVSVQPTSWWLWRSMTAADWWLFHTTKFCSWLRTLKEMLDNNPRGTASYLSLLAASHLSASSTTYSVNKLQVQLARRESMKNKANH